MAFASANAYATEVARVLTTRFSFSREAAIRVVNLNEARVMRGFRATPRASVMRVATVIATAHAKLTSMRAGLSKGPGVGRKSKRRARKGHTAGGSMCTPWIPPVFVEPWVERALEENARKRSSRGAGHVFGKPSKPVAHRTELHPGITRNGDGTSWTLGGAKYVSASRNSKIGAVDTTWVSIESTCVDCAFKDADVCYTSKGPPGIHAKERDVAAAAAKESATGTSIHEAACIDASYEGQRVPDGRVLRLHSSGDTSTVEGAKVIAAAVSSWLARGGAVVYTYTHAWRRVPRSAFGKMSVLASLNPGDDARPALANGYGSVSGLFPMEEWSAGMTITKTGQVTFKSFSPKTGGGLSFLCCPAQYPVDLFGHSRKRNGVEVKAKHEFDLEQNLDAHRFKMVFLGRKLGMDEETSIATFRCKFDSSGLPIVEGHKGFEKHAEAIMRAGFPDPRSDAFRTLFRAIRKNEKATCEKCKQCFDDKELGRRNRGIAFRPDKTGGVIATESLLSKVVAERIAQAAR